MKTLRIIITLLQQRELYVLYVVMKCKVVVTDNSNGEEIHFELQQVTLRMYVCMYICYTISEYMPVYIQHIESLLRGGVNQPTREAFVDLTDHLYLICQRLLLRYHVIPYFILLIIYQAVK